MLQSEAHGATPCPCANLTSRRNGRAKSLRRMDPPMGEGALQWTSSIVTTIAVGGAFAAQRLRWMRLPMRLVQAERLCKTAIKHRHRFYTAEIIPQYQVLIGRVGVFIRYAKTNQKAGNLEGLVHLRHERN
jgi:hypothetical protein